MVRVHTDGLVGEKKQKRLRSAVAVAVLVAGGIFGQAGGARGQSGDTSTTLDPALDTLPPYIEPTTTLRPTLPTLAPTTTTTSTVSPYATTGDLSGVCASIAKSPSPSPSLSGPDDPFASSSALASEPTTPNPATSDPTTLDPTATTPTTFPGSTTVGAAGSPTQNSTSTGCRLVAYYGNPNSPGLGPMGQSPAPQMLSALTALTQRWQVADPQTPTRCALQLIAVVAQGSPGVGSLYRGRASAATINKVIGWGRERGCLTILDVQVGWSNVPAEVAYLEPWLAMPDVHLALDPEWDMPPGSKPGSRIGTMSAADINSAIAVLDRLALLKGLGPRLLIVHRFRSFMVSDPQTIKPTPNIRLVVNMDGFGPVSEKLSSYVVAQKGMPTNLTGMKLFFKLDRPLLGPGEVISLKPAPVFINYQ
jgi:hypothetical protein